MDDRRLPAAFHHTARVALLALIYWGAGEIALTVPFLAGNVNPVWPPTGVALAAVVLFGPRMWPGIFLGEVLANVPDVPVQAVLGMATGNVLEALAAGWLLRRVCRFRPQLDRPADVLGLVVLAAGVSTMVGATFGASSLTLAGVVPAESFWSTWRTWWLGDAMGDLVVAPVALVLLAPGGPRPRPRAEYVAVLAATAVLAELVFGGTFPYAYLVFPAIVWAAVRCHLPGAAASVLITAVLAVVHTARGEGPFTADGTNENLLLLDTFLAVAALTGLTLASVAHQRRKAQSELERTMQTLEDRVAERTEQLAEDRRQLAEAQAMAHIGSWAWDVAADRITWSAELYRIFGLDRARFAADYRSYLERLHPQDRDLLTGAVEEALALGTPYEIDHRILTPGGTVRWVHSRGAVVATDRDGGPVRLQGTCQDVTATMEARRARERADLRYRTIVEAAHEGVWALDADAVTTFVNARMAGMLGHDPAGMVGRSIFQFLAEPSRLIAARRLDRPLRGESEQFEVSFVHRDGSLVWGLVSAAPLPGLDGHGNGVVALVADITERKRLADQLADQALHDALTSLPNRLLLSERIAAALEAAERHRGRVGVLFIDIDRFKWINDSLGHLTGDRVLQEVSRRLLHVVRPTDTVARLGGDEFVVLCEDVAGMEEAMVISRRLIAAFECPFQIDGSTLRLGASVGVAVGDAGDDPGRLIEDADSAMYQAKARGRGRAEAFDEASRLETQQRFEVASGLRRAMEAGELVVHYQPIVSLADEQVVGVEALVRWAHPDGRLIQPGDFIGVAEETGLIGAIDALVLDRACTQVAGWNAARPGAEPLTVAVNLSAAQLGSPELVAVVDASLQRSGLDPRLLHLEITESVLMADVQGSATVLHSLRALGVRLLVDDFGTGYSSLLYLRRFPVDCLKIDRSFVDGLALDAEDAAIVSAVIGLARSLNLKAIAEGVESPQQLERLRALGCHLGQGFRWTSPLPADELSRWLAGRVPVPRPPLSPPSPTRVLVVDDENHFRSAMRIALELDGRFEVVGEAGGGPEGVELSRRHHPDLVLLDLAMPGVSGLDALPAIRDAAPGASVVIVTGDPLRGLEVCLAAGAMACLDKGHGPLDLTTELAGLVGTRR